MVCTGKKQFVAEEKLLERNRVLQSAVCCGKTVLELFLVTTRWKKTFTERKQSNVALVLQFSKRFIFTFQNSFRCCFSEFSKLCCSYYSLFFLFNCFQGIPVGWV